MSDTNESALVGNWKNGKYGTDGTLVGSEWDGRILTGSRTGVPPLALEGRIGRLLCTGMLAGH